MDAELMHRVVQGFPVGEAEIRSLVDAGLAMRLRGPADAADDFGLTPEGVAALKMSVLTLPDGTTYGGRLQYDDDGHPIVREATCGACGFTWNDALCTSITPTPAGRCPNEYGHTDDDCGDDDE
jgi:hypothetical protein